MTQRSDIRIILGLLIWIGIVGGALLLAQKSWQRSPTAMYQLAQFVGNQRYSVEIKFPGYQVVRVGDPVFLAGNESYAPIGFVSRAGATGSTTTEPMYSESAQVTFYGSAPVLGEVREPSYHLDYHAADEDTAWVLKTMLPTSKREEIGQLILRAYAQNQAEIVEAIRPVLSDSLRAASEIIKNDLAAAFALREDRIRAIGQKYQSELIEKELLPLIRDEIWPLIQAESEPLANQIGQEIWQEVSVFRFGWRYLYDRSPLPDQNLAGQEFERFMEHKALPILKSHLTEFLELQKTLIQKISRNETVRDTVSASVKTVVKDPAVQEIFSEVFREVFVNNSRLKEAIETHWQSPRARQAIALTSQRLEPTITEIGVSLFGSPREKITPEFARVLRHRILHKDDRWFMLHIDDPNYEVRGPRPEAIAVRIADPTGEIPYAPSRDRN